MPSARSKRTSIQPASGSEHAITPNEQLMDLPTARFDPQLLDSAFSQIGAGLSDLGLVQCATKGSHSYASFLLRAYRSVSNSMSPGEMTDRIHQVAVTALAAGWISAVAGLQCRLLETLVSVSSGARKPTSSGREPERGQK
jgi:hypothetical protein